MSALVGRSPTSIIAAPNVGPEMVSADRQVMLSIRIGDLRFVMATPAVPHFLAQHTTLRSVSSVWLRSHGINVRGWRTPVPMATAIGSMRPLPTGFNGLRPADASANTTTIPTTTSWLAAGNVRQPTQQIVAVGLRLNRRKGDHQIPRSKRSIVPLSPQKFKKGVIIIRM